MIQKTIAQLIIRFAKQGNMNAVKQLANQVKMPVQNALKSAYSTLRYHARNKAIAFAKQYNRPLPRNTISQRMQELKDNPNVASNIRRVMDENVKKYRK
tara:strand:- start:197 stop:493 length:297 start_codon:yes stop_codon:yes gene_type:complete